MGTGSFPGVKRSGRDADHQPLLALRLRMSRAIPLLSLRAFVACRKGETYLPLNISIATWIEVQKNRNYMYIFVYNTPFH
jgi:hypothetical protein